MEILFFWLISITLLLIDYKRNKQLMSPLTALTIPYMIIIFINNCCAVKIGFYKISDNVCLILLLGIFMFFIGSCFFGAKAVYAKSGTFLDNGLKIDKFQFYNMKAMVRYTLFVEILIFVKILYAVMLHGLRWFVADENEGYLMSGIVGHLMLTLYVVIPILFYYWLNHKNKKKYLICSLMGIAFMFMTFVKYHSICLIVLIYLFIAAENKRYLKKGAIIIAITCIVAFMSNYFMTFLLRNVTGQVSNSFYFYHLWKYIGGGLINDNLLFEQGLYSNVDIFYKCGTMLFALPNMFITVLGFERICPGVTLKTYSVATNGEASNVTDFIGYMFPSKGGIMDIIIFCLFMLAFGLVSRIIYCQFLRRKESFVISVWVYITFFCFFSFFSVYGTLSGPWEILVYSIFIPTIFRGKITLGGHRLGYAKVSNYNS